MTKLLEYFELASGDDNSFRELSPDAVAGTVINTLDRNIVFRIELSNQKQIQSWTSERKLSHKVVYDFESKKYVGVFDSRYLSTWDEAEQQIDKGKIKLRRSLEEVISFDDKHTILVYIDGACESLKNCSEDLEADWTSIVNPRTHQITNIACFNVLENRVMLTYFLRNKQTGVMEFVYFLLNDDTLTPTKNIHRLNIERKDAKLSGFTVVEGVDYPILMEIWSDKRIFMRSIECDKPTPTEFRAFEAMFNALRVDKPLTIASVSKNYVAIYGGNTQQDGASLVLYNTRYNVVKCTHYFKAHLENCRLWVIGKYIFLVMGQKINCWPFRISLEKVSDLIGSKHSIELSGTVKRDCINEERELEDYVSFDREEQQNSGIKQYAGPCVTKTVNGGPTEIFENFNRHLSRLYNHDIEIDVVHNDSLLDLMKTITSVHAEDRPYSTAEITFLADKLENCGSSETEITEHLIPLLIKANLPSELSICLRKYTNISERMLAKSLTFFISLTDTTIRDKYIKQIFACSFNKELIKQHLRMNLNLDGAIKLLELIYDDLRDSEVLLVESPQYGHDFDSDTALINWFTVILDAYFPQLLLAPDPKVNAKISNWKTLIDSFVCGVRELKSINARIKNLVDGKAKQNDNTSSKWYSVEKIQLY